MSEKAADVIMDAAKKRISGRPYPLRELVLIAMHMSCTRNILTSGISGMSSGNPLGDHWNHILFFSDEQTVCGWDKNASKYM
jgi:hypothetical protein